MTPIPLITENFLLSCDAAVRLYHEEAAALPIVDYHCHLSPKEVAQDRSFSNLTEIWLEGDHYKWRALRTAGVDEHFITGSASDWEKFEKWAETTPKTLRNPLYHWTHLELNRPFGINDRLLGPSTAKGIWNDANSKLHKKEFSARGIMRQMNVRLVCTTDDPADSLEHHQALSAETGFDIQVLPTFRPDRALRFESLLPDGGEITSDSLREYNAYLDRLAEVSGTKIQSFEHLCEALKKRHDFFHSLGCRLSDHGFGAFEYIARKSEMKLSEIFKRIRSGRIVQPKEAAALRSELLYRFAKWNAEKQWTMQLHIGAIRNNNTRFFRKLGPDAGFDSILDSHDAIPLSRFFDHLDREELLPKTILYNLNPTANEMMATMIGNFQDGRTPGKMQWGSGWWFLDQKQGMENQLDALSNLGLLSLFVGMLTDSRSFLSYTRHEYFRRILCNQLGREMQDGLIPNDFDLVGKLVRDICYNNAVRYFQFQGLREERP